MSDESLPQANSAVDSRRCQHVDLIKRIEESVLCEVTNN